MAGDQHFASVKVLLLANDTVGSATALDSSPVGRTCNMLNAIFTTTAPKFGAGCASFDGSHDAIECVGTDQALAGDFTIDVWAKTTGNGSTSHYPFIASNDNPDTATNFCLSLYEGTAIYLFYGASQTAIVNGSITLNDGAWHHVALTRASGTIRIYVDGVHLAGATGFNSQLCHSSHRWEWGYWRYWATTFGGNKATWIGTLDCMRVTDGVARWTGTGSFTPPTSEADYLAVTGTAGPLLGSRLLRGGILLGGVLR